MGVFGDQIAERHEADQQALEDAFDRVAGVVLGERRATSVRDHRIVTKHALDRIVKYYHCRPTEAPEDVKDMEDRLDLCLRPHGIMRRSVRLTRGWYKDSYGPLLGFLKEGGEPVALLPGALGGYYYDDERTGERVRIGARTAEGIEEDAYCFYSPLPMRPIGIPDLLLYMKRCVSLSDVVFVAGITLAVTLVGMLMPRITKALTGPVLASGRTSALVGIGVCILCVSLSSQLISSAQGLIMGRVEAKTSLGVQASMMMRLMSLPAGFFRQYSAGELKSRAMSVNQLCSLLLGMVMSAGLSSVTSLLYVTQIFRFAPALVVPALVTILATVVIGASTTLAKTRISRRQRELAASESGMSYAMISGVEKIKLAGAEKRFFARWLDLYAQGAQLTYNPPLFIKVNGVLSTAISLVSGIVLYVLAARTGVDPSSYFAFTAAYGAVMGAFMNLSGTALTAAEIRPILEMAEPFLKAEPESAGGKEVVTRLFGGVGLEHVDFRYDESGPYVLRDLSLKIRAGEYVAIVGKTGCGKSTLMRLLLGFEKPERGVIYYDGRDMARLDLGSLRRRIGSVMQSSGLFQGDIYSNIVMSAPWLTVDEAWEAAETAGIADDIRAMPMGMDTIISEGHGGISGGQRQRLMIARAIAPKPSILLFDEATSALDNKTQRHVSDALARMGCTRVVIAHRLSTIRHCDRILVLEGGRVIEEGSYEELLARGGFFAELVERQRLDVTT